mmetsp:Transcript_11440/g.22793  ORF Transcript_11440/g.22793 Transcript_11440/m.22793 type:complete len:317 (-) Transcript_11440:1034-1984(-)
MTMLLCRYSMIGSLSSLMVQPAAERSALASESSKACSHLSCSRPSISRTRPEKMFFLFSLGTVRRPISMAFRGMACTRSRRVIPGCISPENLTRTDSGMSRGMTPVAAAKATRPDPAGNDTPMGKRVWESPPVPTVSGTSMRLSHEWMMPSPGLRETPPRFLMKSGRVWWVVTSTGLGYAAVWQKDCMTRSAEKPRQARSLSSSLVIGPVVSWLPTVVISGSQYWPGSTPGTPHAFPTIFCAKVYPLLVCSGSTGILNSLDASRPRESRARFVRPRPMMRGMRPPARTSSRRTSVLSSHSQMTSPVSWFFVTPSYG